MVGKRYAVADLHGQSNLYFQIKEYINGNDIVYALGDFGDRGPEPWTTLQLALNDPQFVYIMGNHDLILVEAMEEYMRIIAREGAYHVWDYAYCTQGKMNLAYLNGGLSTLEQWSNLKEEERMKYYTQLKLLPLEVRLAALDGRHFIYLNHSGAHPNFKEWENITDFIWDRSHFYSDWDSKGHLCIGGHSPINYIKKKLPINCYELKEGCLFYNNNSKICIDRGAPYTGETVLLDIDSLKGKVFKTDVH